MHHLPDTYSLRGDFVFTPGQPPREQTWVNVAGGTIVGIGPPAPGPEVVLSGCGIVPGLINAHAHLEFSSLTEPLGTPGMHLPAWIGEVFRWRSASGQSTGDPTAIGIRESLEAGVVAVGDIRTGGKLPQQSPLHLIAFEELIATGSEQCDAAAERARQYATVTPPSRVQLGLSPHAPYSVATPLWQQAIALATERAMPLTVHLAETREELAFLSSGTGPFADLLAARDAAEFVPAGTRPLDFLQLLASAPQVLLAHGNYLSAEEIAFLAAHREQFSLVYCPRTHAYFGHEPYPLDAFLQAQLNVAVGTDGRGSNPDLNLFAELQFLASRFDSLSGDTLLQMGTLAGANALGLSDRLGTLEAGKEASLAVVRLDEGRDPYDRLFAASSRVAATLVAGHLAAGRLESA